MTDKVQKIKEWISKEQDGLIDAKGNFEYPEHEGAYHILCNLDAYIDSLQEEPVSKDKFTFTSLPRLLDRIKPTDRAKWYSSRLADALEEEGYITDAKIVRESIRLMNGEKVPMATMDEEPVSIDFEQELYKAFGQVKDFTLGMRIAKWFYSMGKNSQEPVSEQKLSNVQRIGKNWKESVSEDLKDVQQTITYMGEVYTRCYKDKLDEFACKYPISVPKPAKRYAKYSDVDLTIAVKDGAKWQKEQMIKRLCNHANIDQMVEKFEYKYKPEKVLDTEYYKRGIFDTIKTIKEG